MCGCKFWVPSLIVQFACKACRVGADSASMWSVFPDPWWLITNRLCSMLTAHQQMKRSMRELLSSWAPPFLTLRIIHGIYIEVSYFIWKAEQKFLIFIYYINIFMLRSIHFKNFFIKRILDLSLEYSTI